MFLRFPFNPPGYLRQDQPEPQGRALDILRCPVAEYLAAHGAADLAAGSWCNLDFPLARMWGGTLQRRAAGRSPAEPANATSASSPPAAEKTGLTRGCGNSPIGGMCPERACRFRPAKFRLDVWSQNFTAAYRHPRWAGTGVFDRQPRSSRLSPGRRRRQPR